MESCLSYKADKRERAEEQVDCLKRGLSPDVSTSPDSQVNLVATGQFIVMLVILLPINDRAITIHVTTASVKLWHANMVMSLMHYKVAIQFLWFKFVFVNLTNNDSYGTTYRNQLRSHIRREDQIVKCQHWKNVQAEQTEGQQKQSISTNTIIIKQINKRHEQI